MKLTKTQQTLMERAWASDDGSAHCHGKRERDAAYALQRKGLVRVLSHSEHHRLKGPVIYCAMIQTINPAVYATEGNP